MVDINRLFTKFDFEIELSGNETQWISLNFFDSFGESGNPPLCRSFAYNNNI